MFGVEQLAEGGSLGRVLYIAAIDSYVPSPSADSIQVMSMAGAFAELGHQVTLLVPRGSRHLDAAGTPQVDPFEFYGIEPRFEMHRVRVSGVGGRWGLVLFGLTARRLARRHPWDLVFCRNAFASIALARAGIKHVFEAHHPHLAGGVDRRHLPVLRSPLVQRLVLPGSDQADLFVGVGVDPDKILVAPDATAPPPAALPIDARRQLKRLAGEDEGTAGPIAVCAGSLGPLQGTDQLIEIARLLPHVRFVVIGGPDRELGTSYRRRAADLTNIRFVGVIEPRRVAPLLGAADVLLSPHASSSEQQNVSPRNIFEYMAAGRPIIATDLRSTRAVLDDGRTAILVPPDDSQAQAAAIERVLGDAQLGASLGQAARTDALAHSWVDRARRILESLPPRRPPRRRVLHIINSFAPLIGGAERQVADLARLQTQAGDEVDVLTRRRRGLPRLDGLGPVSVRRVGPWFLGGPGFLVAALGWTLRRRRRFDILHAHQARTPAVVAALARRLGGPPAVVVLVGQDVPDSRGLRSRGRLLALRALDGVVAVSGQLASAARAAGIDNVSVVPTGVDAGYYAPADDRAAVRRALRLRDDELLVLYVGRLEHVKGVDLLCAAWPQVASACPQARLVVVGQGSLQLTPTHASMTLVGRVPDTRPFYQAADLLVLPSRSEGLSIVLLEGMASGLAVVAAAVPGNTEVIEHGVSGILVPPEQPAELAAAILELLRDPERRRLGAGARAAVLSRYRLEAVEEQWAKVYERLT